MPYRSKSIIEEDSKVSVVIVVYMSGPHLFEVIKTVLAEPLVDTLVIVNNGSTTTDLDHLKALSLQDKRIDLITGIGNIGFGRGVNLGVLHAKNQYLLVLNPDAYLKEGCVEKLMAAVGSLPEPSLVGARLLNQDGTEQRGSRRGRGDACYDLGLFIAD